jgi:Domain of unknown function (DUF4159)
MCHHYYSPSAATESRRSFVRKLAAGLAMSAGMLSTRRLLAQGSAMSGSRTGWARLITPSLFWKLHGEQDPVLANFIRKEAHLNLDPTGFSVDPANLDELSSFPFIFTNDLTAVVDPKQVDNLKEYLQRGGFFYVEGCVDHRVNRSFTTYLAHHQELFTKLVPGSEIRQLQPNHPIFRAYFPVEEKNLGLIDVATDDHRWENAPQALYGIYSGTRMISLLSLEHLQCEWLTKPQKIPFCAQQISNIYVYAMTR